MRQGLKVNEPGVKLKYKDWWEERVEDEKMLSELQDLQGMNIAVWCLGILVQRSHQLTPMGEGERRCKAGLASWQNGQRGLRDEHKLSCATAAAGSEQALIANILKTQGEIHSASFLEKDLVCIYEREKTGPRVSVYKDFKVFLAGAFRMCPGSISFPQGAAELSLPHPSEKPQAASGDEPPAVAVLTVSGNGLQFHPAQLRAFKWGRDRLWQQEIQNTLKYVETMMELHIHNHRTSEHNVMDVTCNKSQLINDVIYHVSGCCCSGSLGLDNTRELHLGPCSLSCERQKYAAQNFCVEARLVAHSSRKSMLENQ
ncbi:hypothetical protein Anapl_13413 [Anas platyrhynchos]|uniref:Uncharacterized protein n=1 Tax=Anas platyrhynchos TaxID=8839 RepID=R0JST7_ANAPL|nr:hypothetical protein Anapl_13413 [Anas platyrhynchos]